jgi:hypothetical protein
MRRLSLMLLAAALSACSDNAIDESIVAGSWVIAGDNCSGSGAKLLRYEDGNLVGNNLGVHQPFFKILSAERRDKEVWIKVQSVLKGPDDPIGIVFIENGEQLIGQRTFEGKDFSAKEAVVRTLTWTRCSRAAA